MYRLHSLDYLRGIAAFGIMLYHYASWTVGGIHADSLLGRIGVYGVAIFYMLSGLTLHHVYYAKMQASVRDWGEFFVKRVFRIFPLLWLAAFASIMVTGEHVDFGILSLDLTGLFALFHWESHYALGGWSIGNELVCYLFFPVLVMVAKQWRWGLSALVGMMLAAYLVFGFAVMDPGQTLDAQWWNYTNPLNQIFLFVCGFAMGVLIQRLPAMSPPMALTCAGMGVAVFCFYPTGEDGIHLVSGWNRILFTLASMAICTGCYFLRFDFPQLVGQGLSKLGDTSYAMYLLHPIVFTGIGKLVLAARANGVDVPELVWLPLCIGLTLVGGWIVHLHFEQYFMRMGRSITARFRTA